MISHTDRSSGSAGRRRRHAALAITAGAALLVGAAPAPTGFDEPTAPPPRPERIVVTALPLPPTAPSTAAGSCTGAVNPHGTGCISAADDGIIEGPAYTWDARHVLLPVVFAGAPASGPASAYTGEQVIAVRTDGTRFANGDAWKCLTCGIPTAALAEANRVRFSAREAAALHVDHPQAFPGDTRMIAGTNVFDCGTYKLVDDACTPDRLRVYQIHWTTTTDGRGPSGSMRELRLNPDGIHLMWNHFLPGPRLDQFGFTGRLAFSPKRDGNAIPARYELVSVNVLINPTDPRYAAFRVDPANPNRLIENPAMGAIGEARGWARDGRGIIGMGIRESGNVDLFLTDPATGRSERLTRDPAYTDPVMMSPDDRWLVAMDNRLTERHLYFSAMRGIPPLMDLITVRVPTNDDYGYRNGLRRFFQPFLIHRAGYGGQQLNAGPGTPGSPSDPDWNGRADPAFSPDGSNVVYWQALVTAPACGGANPLRCPVSTEPGRRRARLMIARLVDRRPQPIRPVSPAPDRVAFGTAYQPGAPLPARQSAAPAGRFTLRGAVRGEAQVEIRKNAAGDIVFVSAAYRGFSNDGRHVIDGTERSERIGSGADAQIVWHSDLRASGVQIGTKRTLGPAGFVSALSGQPLSGQLVTEVDGRTYRRVTPGT